MKVGLLYESDEWSDHELARELRRALREACPDREHDVEMIDMRADGSVAQALACDALVSRVFASSVFRDHGSALANMDALIEAMADHPILLINEPLAHGYEVSKARSTAVLEHAGLHVPRIFACGTPRSLSADALPCPCVIKPDCGGRTTLTAIARSSEEAASFLASAPDMDFIIEEYIEPERGHITRVEIVNGKAIHVAERSIAENGLSAYHLGSAYRVVADPSPQLQREAERAAEALGFVVGSFDIIETDRGAFFIDANSVSNVSEDCTELLGIDLMRLHAEAIAAAIAAKEDARQPSRA